LQLETVDNSDKTTTQLRNRIQPDEKRKKKLSNFSAPYFFVGAILASYYSQTTKTLISEFPNTKSVNNQQKLSPSKF
jgi:hypothetical protein